MFHAAKAHGASNVPPIDGSEITKFKRFRFPVNHLAEARMQAMLPFNHTRPKGFVAQLAKGLQ